MRLAFEALTVLVPGGLLAAAMLPLLRCRHPREMFDRFPDGRPALRCSECLHLRANVLFATAPQYHRTQEGGPVAPSRRETGIERVWAELDHPITDLELFGVH